ncbi:unnamed protein product [Gongylonema pulchrum]|uniref:Uncharacterized protein n=1 Tax=Gongylonema pulchrum TaxID=637853 RepID=A0A183ER04_9BILA|nr:unnamed protein product [Gongylonema pulchrum]
MFRSVCSERRLWTEMVLEETAFFRSVYMRRSCCIVRDYLDMLNTWGLWTYRARLDCFLGWSKRSFWVDFKEEPSTLQAITRDKLDIPPSPSASISSPPDPVNRTDASSSQSSSNGSTAAPVVVREMACPQCLKPLPKCVLCRRHLGSYVQTECPDLGRLSSWFTWCQV